MLKDVLNNKIIDGIYYRDNSLILDMNKYIYHNSVNGFDLLGLDELNIWFGWTYRNFTLEEIKRSFATNRRRVGDTSVYYICGISSNYNVVLILKGKDIYVVKASWFEWTTRHRDMLSLVEMAKLSRLIYDKDLRNYYLFRLFVINDIQSLESFETEAVSEIFYSMDKSELTDTLVAKVDDVVGGTIEYNVICYNNCIYLLELQNNEIDLNGISYRLSKDLIHNAIYLKASNGSTVLHKVDIQNTNLNELSLKLDGNNIKVVG